MFGGRADMEGIEAADGDHDRLELVIAVGAFAVEFEEEVQLGGGADD
jgi:hypothetical protein